MGETLTYLLAAVFTAVIATAGYLHVRPPVLLYLGFAAAGITVTFLFFGLPPALISLGVALLVLIALAAVASALVSGITIFTVVTVLAMLPWWQWWTIAVGLGIAGLGASLHVRSTRGKGHVAYLAAETMTAFGLSPTGQVLRPDLERIPVPTKDAAQPTVGERSEPAMDVDALVVGPRPGGPDASLDENAAAAARPTERRWSVALFLLAGLVIGAAASVAQTF